MKITVLAFLRVFILGVLMTFAGCDDETEKTKHVDDALFHKWELFRVANIADDQKILNSVLVIDSDGEFFLYGNDGVLDIEGKWTYNNETITLTEALFDNGAEPEYKVLLLNHEELHLQQHYTLDNKDSYLEYHFQVKE